MHVMWTRRATAALAIALAAATAPLVAQQPVQTELPASRIPGWSFTPSLAGGTTYDSNLALTEPQATQTRAQGDAFFSLVPGGELEYFGRRSEFSASYRGFIQRYFDAEGLNGIDQRSVVGFRRTMSRRLTLYVRNNFADTPTTDEVEVNGVPFRRTGSRTNTFAANADIRLSRRTTLGTRYDMTWVDFDRTDQFLTGGTIHGIRTDLSRQLSDRLSVGGEYGFRNASLDEGNRDYAFQDAGGNVRFKIGPHTSANAAAGLAVLHDHTASTTHSGPYVRLGIDRTLELATVGAAFERSYVPSFGFGGSSSSQELRAYVMKPFARQRLYVQGSAAWRRSIPFVEDALELDTIWLRSTLGYTATRWARIEALYAFTRQDSIVTGGEINRHRIGMQFVISQPMRIH